MPGVPARWKRVVVVGVTAGLLALGAAVYLGPSKTPKQPEPPAYKPRQEVDTSGFMLNFLNMEPWSPHAELEDYADSYRQVIPRGLEVLDQMFRTKSQP